MGVRYPVVFCLTALLSVGSLSADDGAKRLASPQARRQWAVTQGIDYLATKGQAPDGSYSSNVSPAVTALVTAGIVRSGRTADDPVVAKSLKYLEGFVQPDGGIYNPQGTN